MSDQIQPEILNSLKIIKDEAAEEDFFGSHSRIAKAMATLIKAANTKVVGLLGAWGSGKSTVIKLVQKQLESEETPIKTYCFCYDAWLHQNDPPRRSFLETLIHFLIEKKLTTEKEWREKLAQLNRRIEETEVTSTPALTFSGRLIVFSLLLIPLGGQFVSYQWYNAAFKETGPNTFAIFAFIFGSLSLLLPLGVATLVYIFWRPTLPFWKKELWTTHKAPYEQESIISLFMSKEVQKRRNKVTRAPDPTTIEFQDIFREIMQKVSNDKRRFLFVIDNLDRLPETEAVAMWGTIRSFFLGAEETNYIRKALPLPTVILPIDEEAVKRMYTVIHKEDADRLAKSFMDKTFDLTFRVTRPVLSDWNAYLAKQMKVIFGENVPNDWIYLVGRLYERYLINVNISATPRAINTLLNTIGTLCLQWQGQNIKFVSIAYYAVYRELVDANILSAVQTPQAGIDELDTNWQRSIAAMHYGVPPEEAIQILIEQPLRKAILDRDATAFKELSSVRAFEYVLQRVLDPTILAAPIEPVFVLNASLLFNDLSLRDQVWVLAIWKTLRSGLGKTSVLKNLTSDDVKSLKALIFHCPPQELEQLAKTTINKLSSADSSAFDGSTFPSAFVEIAQEIREALDENKLDTPSILVPGTARTFLETLSSSMSNSKLLQNLKTNIPSAEWLRELARNLNDSAASSEAVENKIRALIAYGYQSSWDELIGPAVQIIQSQNGNYPGMASALACLGLLRKNVDSAKAQIQTLVDNNLLLTRLHEATSSNNQKAQIYATALLLLHNLSIPGPNGVTWDKILKDHTEFVSSLNKALLEFNEPNSATFLFKHPSANGDATPLIRGILSYRVKEGKIGSLDIDYIITNLETAFRLLEREVRESFIEKISRYSNFWEKMKEASFKGNVIAILHILLKTKDNQDTAKTFVKTHLESAPTDAWEKALREGAEPFNITTALLQQTDQPISIGSQLFEVLEKTIPELLINTDKSFRERWFEMSAFISQNARQTLFKNVRDKINSGTQVQQLAELLSIRNDTLLMEGDFSNDSDDSVRHIILPLLITPEGLNWLIDKSKSLKSWVSGSAKNTRSFLVERLSEDWDKGDDAQKDTLQKLGAAWSLDKLPIISATIENTDSTGE